MEPVLVTSWSSAMTNVLRHGMGGPTPRPSLQIDFGALGPSSSVAGSSTWHPGGHGAGTGPEPARDAWAWSF
eukprot:8366599-Lingulodinium_polyedra.AAC.1